MRARPRAAAPSGSSSVASAAARPSPNRPTALASDAAQPDVRGGRGGALARSARCRRGSVEPVMAAGSRRSWRAPRRAPGRCGGCTTGRPRARPGPAGAGGRTVGADQLVGASASASDVSLSSAIASDGLGELEENRPPKPQQRWSADHATRSQPSTASSSALGLRRPCSSRSMWHEWWYATRSGRRGRGAGRSSVGEELGELAGAGAQGPGPRAGVVVAGHLEQLRPEDPDHRGARPGGHDDGVAAVGARARRAWCGPPCRLRGKPEFQAGWPQHV